MCFLFSSDDVYHSEDDPPPFHENQDFDFGLDNKSIRRAFIRKVRDSVVENTLLLRHIFKLFLNDHQALKYLYVHLLDLSTRVTPFRLFFHYGLINSRKMNNTTIY